MYKRGLEWTMRFKINFCQTVLFRILIRHSKWPVNWSAKWSMRTNKLIAVTFPLRVHFMHWVTKTINLRCAQGQCLWLHHREIKHLGDLGTEGMSWILNVKGVGACTGFSRLRMVPTGRLFWNVRESQSSIKTETDSCSIQLICCSQETYLDNIYNF
jgi:hypothetical protein